MLTEDNDSGLPSVEIRFDGGDADRHVIDLRQFADSMQGMARIIGTVGHLAITGEFVKTMPAQDVRVLIREPRANCVTVTSVLEFAQNQQILQGSVGIVIGAILTWLFTRHRAEEMKAIKDSLDRSTAALERALLAAHAGNQAMVPRLLSSIERMAESLRPSMRQAVAPIGMSCKTMTIGRETQIDEQDAAAIRSAEDDTVTEERLWDLFITEMDRESKTAKVRLLHDDEADRRFRAVITDPEVSVSGNVYLRAFADGSTLTCKGKATMRDGELHVLFISNAT